MDEILVSTSHGRGRPAVVGFVSGFFVIWTDPGDQNLKGARFDASGTRRGDDFVVNTTRGIFGLPAVERIPGGFVVAWIAFPPSKLLFQRFAMDGSKNGPEVVVSTANVVADLERIRAPAVASLADGNFVITWLAALPDTQVRAATFDSFDGHRVGSEVTVNASEGLHTFPAVTAFRGVGSDDIAYVIAWTGGANGILRSRFQMFNIDRTKAGPEVLPRNRVGEIGSVIFPQNTNDPREFIGVLGGVNGNEEQLVVSELFLRDGTSLGTNITHNGDQTVNFEPLVEALPNGRAVVTWTQKPVPTTGRFGNSVMAAILEVGRESVDFIRDPARGTAINTTAAGGQRSISASPMVDEIGNFRIAFAWVDARIDGSQSAIKARVLSSALT
jgi:hypothetical protein